MLLSLWGENMYNHEDISNRIYLARINSDMKQKDAAIHLNINQSSYSAIETGKRIATIEELHILSGLFKVPLIWLIGIKEDDFSDKENLMIEEYKHFIRYIRDKK